MKLMNTLLIAGGGYFVLKYLGIDPLASLGGVFNTIIGNVHDNSSVSTPQANGPVTVDIKNMIAAAMTGDGMDPRNHLFSVDVWNWYYNKVRGVVGPSPEELFASHERNTNYTLDEYWSAMSARGFSGLYSYHGMQGGMGVIARMNPWINHYTPGPGRTVLPLGSETFIKSFGVN